QYSQD
ncbi:hypothetical protein CP061683_2561B, partial [Chlamydia psittaci 06-1683]